MGEFKEKWRVYYGDLKAKKTMIKTKEMFGVHDGSTVEDHLPDEPERPEVKNYLEDAQYKACLKEARALQAAAGRPHDAPVPKPSKPRRKR